MSHKIVVFATLLFTMGIPFSLQTQAAERTLPEVNPPKTIACSPNRIGVFTGKVYVTCSQHDGPNHIVWFNLDFGDKEFVNRAIATINTAIVAGKKMSFFTIAPDGHGSDWRLVKGFDMYQ